jgi:DNA-binding NarL/FixJ family response regulator
MSRSALRLLLQNQLPEAAVIDVKSPAEIPTSDPGEERCLLVYSWDSPAKETERVAWIEYFKKRDRQMKVIALSGRPEASCQTYQAGADVFVCKCDPPERLLSVLEKILLDSRGI